MGGIFYMCLPILIYMAAETNKPQEKAKLIKVGESQIEKSKYLDTAMRGLSSFIEEHDIKGKDKAKFLDTFNYMYKQLAADNELASIAPGIMGLRLTTDPRFMPSGDKTGPANWAAYYLYKTAMDSPVYTEPTEVNNTATQWNGLDSLSDHFGYAVLADGRGIKSFLELDPLDTKTNKRSTVNRSKEIKRWLTDTHDNFSKRYTGYNDEIWTNWDRDYQWIISRLDDGITPDEYLVLQRLTGRSDLETLLADLMPEEATKKAEEEAAKKAEEEKKKEEAAASSEGGSGSGSGSGAATTTTITDVPITKVGSLLSGAYNPTAAQRTNLYGKLSKYKTNDIIAMIPKFLANNADNARVFNAYNDTGNLTSWQIAHILLNELLVRGKLTKNTYNVNGNAMYSVPGTNYYWVFNKNAAGKVISHLYKKS